MRGDTCQQSGKQQRVLHYAKLYRNFHAVKKPFKPTSLHASGQNRYPKSSEIVESGIVKRW